MQRARERDGKSHKISDSRREKLAQLETERRRTGEKPIQKDKNEKINNGELK